MNHDIFRLIWTEKYRPQTLDELILSENDRNLISSFKEKKSIPNLLFAGPPGIGKTTLAKIICREVLNCQYIYINASDENGIDTIRGKVNAFVKTKALDGKTKVVLLDECDAITSQGMAALRSVMEEFVDNCRFILTCNYLYKIIPAIQSRCVHLNLCPPLDKILKRVVFILHQESIIIHESQLAPLVGLVKKHTPDIRRIINELQKFSITGELKIPLLNLNQTLSATIIQKILQKTPLQELRNFIITNEESFNGDYLVFLKEMFEEVFTTEILTESERADCLMAIAETMKNHAVVLDKEINAFACVVFLFKIITSRNNA